MIIVAGDTASVGDGANDSLALAMGQARVKVHKDRIIVSGTDEMGFVTVQGLAGAIDSTSPTKLVVERHVIQEVKVDKKGSFKTQIEANPTDKIVVRARNREGKVSRGTFRVPKVTEATADKKPETIETQRRLAVVIQVIDLDSGETLSEKKFEYSKLTNSAREVFKVTRNIVMECMQVVKQELTQNGKAKSQQQKPNDETQNKSEESQPENSLADPNNP